MSKATGRAADARVSLLAVALATIAEAGWKRWPSISESHRYYLWHDEDPNGEAIPVFVAFDAQRGELFATQGQHGWRRAQTVKEMGGWWMLITPPEFFAHPNWFGRQEPAQPGE